MKLSHFVRLWVGVCALGWVQVEALAAEVEVGIGQVDAFKSRLLSATRRHLNLLAESPNELNALKGKSAAGMTALAFYLTFEATGEQRYRAAALQLAEGILAEMRATKFGVL